MGTKSDDFHGVFACSACHKAFDEHDWDAREIDGYMLDALQRTIRHWIVNGDLIIAGLKDDPKPKKSSKTLPPRRAFYRRATIVNKGKA